MRQYTNEAYYSTVLFRDEYSPIPSTTLVHKLLDIILGDGLCIRAIELNCSFKRLQLRETGFKLHEVTADEFSDINSDINHVLPTLWALLAPGQGPKWPSP